MIYQVTSIQEDIDFGCEERSADAPVLAVVTMRDENGEKMIKKIPDQYLYDAGIDVGTEVIWNNDGMLEKNE